jgi:hypothetical protein
MALDLELTEIIEVIASSAPFRACGVSDPAADSY